MKNLHSKETSPTRPLRIVVLLCIVILLLSLKVSSQQASSYWPLPAPFNTH